MADNQPLKPPKDSKAHPRLGINAQRSCTDCPMLFLFLIAWCAMVYVAQLAFVNGAPERLIRGTDYLADTCGVGDLKDKPLLWYPFGYNGKTGDFVIKDALKMGLCVATCPPKWTLSNPLGGRLAVYGPPATRTLFPEYWIVLFDSVPKFHRCMPDFGTFDCTQGSSNVTECEFALNRANGTWADLSKFDDLFEQGFEEVKSSWWIILAGIGIVIVLSFVWLFILRRLVKPVVVLTLFLVLAALIGLGILFWTIKAKKEGLTPPQTETANYYKYAAVTSWVVAGIYFCVMLFLWRDLMTACDIIEEATKVPLSIPTMAFVPPFSLLAVIPFLVFALIVAVYIQSSGDKVDFEVPFANAINSTAAQFATIPNATGDALTRTYVFSNWRIYAHLFNLLMFLWTFGFISAIAFMTLALCGVYWYWSNPGDHKTPPPSAVTRALCTTLRYHMGTVAIGSLLVALIQLARVVLVILEQRMKELHNRTEAARFLFKVLNCCLAYLERVVKFINKNGYIMCAMQGSNFVTSARDALNLLAANALSVGAVTVIAEYVMLFGKVLVTIATMILTYLIIQAANKDDGLTGGWVILLIVMIVAFLVSCLFANVFAVCIDTVLLCYCYDRKEDGEDYYPTDLAKHVDAATLARGRKMKDQEQELLRMKNQGGPVGSAKLAEL
jgi:choline transporter-like protein 2/4/5